MSERYIVGFDPGGINAFGWAVLSGARDQLTFIVPELVISLPLSRPEPAAVRKMLSKTLAQSVPCLRSPSA